MIPDLPPVMEERVVCSVVAAVRWQVPANLVLAVAEVEGGRPGLWVRNANGTHDVGPMQLNTAYLAAQGAPGPGPGRPLDPRRQLPLPDPAPQRGLQTQADFRRRPLGALAGGTVQRFFNQGDRSMKKIVKLMCGLLVLAGYAGEGVGKPKEKLDQLHLVDRVTYVGPKRETSVNGGWTDYETFRQEFGTLHCKEGFIPSAAFDGKVEVGTDAGPEAAGIAQTEQYKAVAGLNLIKLNSYVTLGKYANLNCFPRSGETYSFDQELVPVFDANVPYVAVADRPGVYTGPLPYASTSATVAETTEGGAPAEFLIVLNRAYGKPVVVQFTIGGTARNGQDYKPLKKKVTIPAGNLSTTVAIVPKRDRKAEGTETVILTLKPNKKYGISSQGSATVTISDVTQ